jgi:hypothetical protein
MKGRRLLLSLVLAAVVALVLAGAASADRLDVADFCFLEKPPKG